jgi:hypothetical protein
MSDRKLCWGMVRRRELVVPTWRGWLLLFAIVFLGAFCAVRGIHGFLSVNDPKPGGVLVVEGWAADYALADTVTEFNRNHYDKLYVTGGPIEQGAALSEYHTYAELATAVLVKLGMSTNVMESVPAPAVVKDRTYASAVALRACWKASGISPKTVNLMTEGSHARRSRLLFEKALGAKVAVGVIALPSRAYDPKHWWRSSQGVRTEIGESFAYVYARFLFHPPKSEPP